MSDPYNPLTDDAAEALADEHRLAGHHVTLMACVDCAADLGYMCHDCNGRIDLADHRPDTCGEVANGG